MADLVFVCTAPLDAAGQCPEGASTWQELPSHWAMPPVEELSQAFTTSVNVFFVTTMVVCLVAWAVRLILDGIQ